MFLMGRFSFPAYLRLITLAVILPVLAGAAPAQNSDAATVSGSVRDSAGHVVAGATVSLLGSGTATPAVAVSDSQGAYHFAEVATGAYTLRASAPQCGETTYGPFRIVTQNESKQIDLTFKKVSSPSNSGAPEFFDEPAFTVAGVTDTTNMGAHGSNTVARNNVALAKDVASLSTATAKTGGAATEHSASEQELHAAAEHARALLEQRNVQKREQAELHHSLGDIEEKLGDPLQAVREFQLAAELEPSEGNVFDWGAELLLHHAPEPATEVFGKGNRLYPRSSRMLAGLGVAWYARGSNEQAAQKLGEASDLNPDDPGPYLFLGKLQSLDTTHSDLFVDRLARFARLHPANAQANYYYALSLWKQREGSEDPARFTQIESLLQKAVAIDPTLGAAYLQLGILYSDHKLYPKAIELFHKAIVASPELEEAHYRMALAYRQIGDKQAADKEFHAYEQLSKQKEEEDERARHEIQQFVYSLQGKVAASGP